MEHVLVAIGNPWKAPLYPSHLQRLTDALGDAGARPGDSVFLDPSVAGEVPFVGDPATALTAAREALAGWAFDLNVLPREGRRKKLLVADMDSTIIGCECIDELADVVGVKAKVAEITERAMRGDIDFKGALRERVAMLRGMPTAALETVFRERVKLNPGARRLVQTMKRNGARTALVSGGFTFFTSRVRDACGFDFDQANELLAAEGRLIGAVKEPILDSDAKLDALLRLSRQLGLAASETLAVGDGANDLPMIQAAGFGVAFHAKPKVAAAAAYRLEHADLRGLLYLQGYRRGEIVLD